MIRAALALVVLVSACDAPVLRIRAYDETQPTAAPLDELPDEVLDACDLLGLACEATARSYRALTLSLHEPDGQGTSGRAWSRGCRPIVWANMVPATIAHEIGHAYGLEHDDDPEAIMYGSADPDRWRLGDRDRARLHRRVRLCGG